MRDTLKDAAYPTTTAPNMDRIVAELKAQRELIEKQGAMLKSIRRSLRVSGIMSLLRMLIILIPLIIAAIYLPPLIRNWVGMFSDYQSAFRESTTFPQGIDVQQVQDLLQKSGLFER